MRNRAVCGASGDPRSPTVSVATVGCKANREEMECLASRLVDGGFRLVPFGDAADLTIVNTCTVTSAGDADSRRAVRRAAGSGSRIVVTGCLAQRDPSAFGDTEGVALVLGNAEKATLAERILRTARDRGAGSASSGAGAGFMEGLTAPPGGQTRVEVGSDPTLRSFPRHGRARDGRRTRGVLKVQDGCDRACAYCIVPAVRGASRSRPLAECCEEAALLVQSGAREVVLTGINSAAWGRDLSGRLRLPDLVAAMAAVPGVVRIRLSSLEPGEIGEEWLERLAGEPRLCRHFHLSLQSADPGVLERMGRPPAPGGPDALLARLRRLAPGCALGCDLVAGLPGETEAAFLRTLRFVEEQPLAYVHVFTYSPRPGTAAAMMSDAPAEPVRRERSARLRACAARKRSEFAKSQIGTLQEVLLERPCGPGRGQGLSGNYLRLRFPWTGEGPDRTGLLAVRVTAANADGSAEGIVTGEIDS